MTGWEFLGALLREAWFALGPALGLLLGHWLTLRRIKEERQRQRIRQQVAEFYSPMLGLLERALALADTRRLVAEGADRALQKLIPRGQPDDDPVERSQQFEQIVQYNNRQLREELLPLYAEMVALFSRGYWLAEESTRRYFVDVVRFQEIWHRALSKALPAEVARELPKPDLEPFRSELRTTLQLLTSKLV